MALVVINSSPWMLARSDVDLTLRPTKIQTVALMILSEIEAATTIIYIKTEKQALASIVRRYRISTHDICPTDGLSIYKVKMFAIKPTLTLINVFHGSSSILVALQSVCSGLHYATNPAMTSDIQSLLTVARWPVKFICLPRHIALDGERSSR